MLSVLPGFSTSTATVMTCPATERLGEPVGSLVVTLTNPGEEDDPSCGAVHPLGMVTRTVPSVCVSAAGYTMLHVPLEPAATFDDGVMMAVPLPGPASVSGVTPAAISATRPTILMGSFSFIGFKKRRTKPPAERCNSYAPANLDGGGG